MKLTTARIEELRNEIINLVATSKYAKNISYTISSGEIETEDLDDYMDDPTIVDYDFNYASDGDNVRDDLHFGVYYLLNEDEWCAFGQANDRELAPFRAKKLAEIDKWIDEEFGHIKSIDEIL